MSELFSEVEDEGWESLPLWDAYGEPGLRYLTGFIQQGLPGADAMLYAEQAAQAEADGDNERLLEVLGAAIRVSRAAM